MTALLELKQKLKNFYAQNETYLLPLVKFAIAFAFFYWIRTSLGFMAELNNIFVLLILALICSILPPVVMVCMGFVLIFMHAYAIGLEAAIFTGILLLLLAILFLRFSGGQSIVMVCTPLAYVFDIPVLLPVGSGLLGSVLTAFPAGCGVILYYFVRILKNNADALSGSDLEMIDKFRLLADNLFQNWALWLTVVAFITVILLVNLIRTRSFDYAWRVAIVIGAAAYVIVMVTGSFFIDVTISYEALIIQTVISVILGFVLEFVFFGGDYSRTERLQYEDDEYYYYVKAVPKNTVAVPERSVKRITGQSREKEDRRSDRSTQNTRPTENEGKASGEKEQPAAVDRTENVENVDFEKKLEESLKEL